MVHTAFVTGGAGGIGAEISRSMAAAGCNVAIGDIDVEAANALVDDINTFQGRECAIAIDCDVSVDASTSAALIETEKKLGPVSILVNNVGWDKIIPFTDTTPDFWDKVIAINLRGPVNLTHGVIAQMRSTGYGRIINIASDAGRVGSSGEAVYSACKGGMISFAKTLARELARDGFTCNTVCPGPTDTPLLHAQLGGGEAGQKIYEGLKRAIPMRRLGQPTDIAGIVTFLASEDASFITGQTISVSGGLTMQG
ncbi:SDR family oxidoreductase [Ruegeria sp. EL01]|uniref:SDR family oxidoreductase n=1 Tax=Ruegeria sp. EL01 TaxID=2107578 RepID=UPI000EA81660|nr:SDR family oxidoreductase [Ruegeria sp. EL01]